MPSLVRVRTLVFSTAASLDLSIVYFFVYLFTNNKWFGINISTVNKIAEIIKFLKIYTATDTKTVIHNS